jgi:hypothetical protein
MISNGSESLHKVFKEARGRPVCVIVITTYYKLLEWFNKRKLLARELAGINQIFMIGSPLYLKKGQIRPCNMKSK